MSFAAAGSSLAASASCPRMRSARAFIGSCASARCARAPTSLRSSGSPALEGKCSVASPCAPDAGSAAACSGSLLAAFLAWRANEVMRLPASPRVGVAASSLLGCSRLSLRSAMLSSALGSDRSASAISGDASARCATRLCISTARPAPRPARQRRRRAETRLSFAETPTPLHPARALSPSHTEQHKQRPPQARGRAGAVCMSGVLAVPHLRA